MIKKKIIITGLSGMVGSYLQTYFEERGYFVDGPSIEDLSCSDKLLSILAGSYAVINLAGRNIFSKRWNKREKKDLYNSRVETTKMLVECMNNLIDPPKVLISASALGYYGIDVQNADEKTVAGSDFLATLCKDWEDASQGYTKGRVVNTRFAVILSKNEGFLERIIKATKLGFLSTFGKGNGLMNFVSIDDVAKSIEMTLDNENIHGPINVCFSKSISQKAAFEIIANKFHRKRRFSLPKWLVKLLFGEMGEALFLADQQVHPRKLQDLEYNYVYKDFSGYIDSL